MPNKIDLAGRNAVVTGGAQGIGRAITERLLDSGAAVAIWDRDKEFAEKTAKELSNRGKVIVVACDVTNLKDVERACDVGHAGPPSLRRLSLGVGCADGQGMCPVVQDRRRRPGRQ